MQKQSPKEYILSRINIDESTGCWNWTAGIGRGGYGRAKHLHKEHKAHRYAYEAFVGEIPKDKILCHKCDNPRCVNPAHVYVGTHKDNSHDRGARGRYKNGRQKLSADDVKQIRTLYNDGLTPSQLSAKFGVSTSNVFRILNNKTSPDYTYVAIKKHKKVFSQEQVNLIREMRCNGSTYKEIQNVIPRDHRSLWEIVNNKIYKDPNYTPPPFGNYRHKRKHTLI
jgi:hypothetical protein